MSVYWICLVVYYKYNFLLCFFRSLIRSLIFATVFWISFCSCIYSKCVKACYYSLRIFVIYKVHLVCAVIGESVKSYLYTFYYYLRCSCRCLFYSEFQSITLWRRRAYYYISVCWWYIHAAECQSFVVRIYAYSVVSFCKRACYFFTYYYIAQRLICSTKTKLVQSSLLNSYALIYVSYYSWYVFDTASFKRCFYLTCIVFFRCDVHLYCPFILSVKFFVYFKFNIWVLSLYNCKRIVSAVLSYLYAVLINCSVVKYYVVHIVRK